MPAVYAWSLEEPEHRVGETRRRSRTAVACVLCYSCTVVIIAAVVVVPSKPINQPRAASEQVSKKFGY